MSKHHVRTGLAAGLLLMAGCAQPATPAPAPGETQPASSAPATSAAGAGTDAKDLIGRMAAAQAGVRTYLELAPTATLSALISHTHTHIQAPTALCLPALRADQPEPHTLMHTLAAAHTHGTPIDWAAVWAGHRPRRVALPGYPFQRQRFWLTPQPGAGTLTAAGLHGLTHPFLGAAVALGEDAVERLEKRVQRLA